MEITEVKVFPVRDKKLRAFASIVLDASFMVNDIKVIQGKDGLFISMPSRRQKNGRFKDIAHPLNQETRQVLEDRILTEFRRVSESGEDAPKDETETAPSRRVEGRRPDAARGPAAAEGPAASQDPVESGGPALSRPSDESRSPIVPPAAAAAAPAAVPAHAADSSGAPEGPVAAEKPVLAGKPVLAEETVSAEPSAEAAADDSEDKGRAAGEKSLEEVAEDHLSDSYWTT